MKTQDAINILEIMAVDMTGAMDDMKATDPLKDVLKQRIDAINTAQDALRAQTEDDPPSCYEPDGDGCNYQVHYYGGEPIEKCKECPYCYADKVRHDSNTPTKADRIRAMSDKELAEFLNYDMKALIYCHSGPCLAGESCVDCMLKWLKQPAPEEGEQHV